MAMLLGRTEVEIKKISVTCTVPDDPVAKLMYYFGCVCSCVETGHDATLGRLKDYERYRSLTSEEEVKLLVLCLALSPDNLIGTIFFPNEDLDCSNELFELKAVNTRLVVAESLLIGGQQRRVHTIMMFKKNWIERNYITPMLCIVQGDRLTSRRQPAIIGQARSPGYRPPGYRPPAEQPSPFNLPTPVQSVSRPAEHPSPFNLPTPVQSGSRQQPPHGWHTSVQPNQNQSIHHMPRPAVQASPRPPAQATPRPPAQATPRPPAQANARPSSQANARPSAQANARQPAQANARQPAQANHMPPAQGNPRQPAQANPRQPAQATSRPLATGYQGGMQANSRPQTTGQRAFVQPSATPSASRIQRTARPSPRPPATGSSTVSQARPVARPPPVPPKTTARKRKKKSCIIL